MVSVFLAACVTCNSATAATLRMHKSIKHKNREMRGYTRPIKRIKKSEQHLQAETLLYIDTDTDPQATQRVTTSNS